MANPGRSRLETERSAAEGGVNVALPGGDLGKYLTLMAVGLVAWILIYRQLAGLSQWITYDVFGFAEGAALGSSVQFFTLSLIHISEPTRRTPISYAVFCLKKKK